MYDNKIHLKPKTRLIRGILCYKASQNQSAKCFGYHFSKFAYFPYVSRLYLSVIHKENMCKNGINFPAVDVEISS